MRRGFFFTLVAGMLGFAMSASAATINFTITQTPDGDAHTGTWSAFLQIVGTDTAGLASFNLDVVGGGSVSVTGSALAAPAGLLTFSPLVTDGFNTLTSPGVNGIGIAASQNVISGPAGAIYQGVGMSAGASSGAVSASWALPVLLATGTYSNTGNGGQLTAQIHTGGLIGLLNGANGSGYVFPGNTTNLNTAQPGNVTVLPIPEPASMVLLGIGVVGLLGRRRKA